MWFFIVEFNLSYLIIFIGDETIHVHLIDSLPKYSKMNCIESIEQNYSMAIIKTYKKI